MEHFGHRFNTSKGTVNNWEKGRNLPNKENLLRIANLGAISVEQLLSAEKNPMLEMMIDWIDTKIRLNNILVEDQKGLSDFKKMVLKDNDMLGMIREELVRNEN